MCLEKSGEVVCQMVPRVNETAKGVIRTEFSVDCYNISVVDWEENGSIGSLDVPYISIGISHNMPDFNMCTNKTYYQSEQLAIESFNCWTVATALHAISLSFLYMHACEQKMMTCKRSCW